ncbi:MAG: UDP-N-acetylmuramate--L-alanine ligase [Bacteroidales bacterium]
MDLKSVNKVYFLGIGGIGMSALARYFLAKGAAVFGYDKIPSAITDKLTEEGAVIHFDDEPAKIPTDIELAIYTPAIPKNQEEYKYLKNSDFTFIKRAEALGLLSENTPTIAVAGTHGKTTVSCFLAHILKTADFDFYAFLGGLCTNYNSNFIHNGKPDWFLIEADEFDRSFLNLKPEMAVITAMDPDHLDVYNNKTELINNFMAFCEKVKPGGKLIMKNGLQKPESVNREFFNYHVEENSDLYAENIRINNGYYYADFHGLINQQNVKIGLPGRHNLENALAASMLAYHLGIDKNVIVEALASFKGVKRRFEICFKNDNKVYIDDYAHHPEEIKACINAAKELYPGKRILSVFQPHLYSRTRDFAEDFAKALSITDEVILLDIYPARELPIEGVNSEMILNLIENDSKSIVAKQQLTDTLNNKEFDVLITMGAGDIDRLVGPVTSMMQKKFSA